MSSHLPIAGLLLACLLSGAAPSALAQDAAAPEAPLAEAVYAPATGDAWVDRQLADINRYAGRYPDAFLDELMRYGGARRAYAAALLNEQQWPAGDIYFACVWGKVSGLGCRELVRARSRLPQGSWADVLASRPEKPQNTQWRALRHAIVASFDHWERPIELDALLRSQLGDREQRRQMRAEERDAR